MKDDFEKYALTVNDAPMLLSQEDFIEFIGQIIDLSHPVEAAYHIYSLTQFPFFDVAQEIIEMLYAREYGGGSRPDNYGDIRG
jgi:hypothetical protein